MITKNNNLKVMELFYKYPTRTFHIREVARLVNLSSTGIIKIVKNLKSENLLVSEKKNMIEEIKPNLNGSFYLSKRLYNIFSLYDSGLVNEIKKLYEQPSAIILFGSYSSGLDTENSDIDIAVISKGHKEFNLDKFEKKLNRKINIHVIHLETASKEFKNSLANGLVLEGFMEVIK